MARMYVREVMHHGVIHCSAETTVEQAIALMQSNHIHALVVVEEPGYLCGIVSQTDLLEAWQKDGSYENSMHRPVSEVMTPGVVSCRPDMDLERAIKLLNHNHIHRLVVAEERNDGRFWPIGILSMTDLVRALETDDDLVDAIRQGQVLAVNTE